MKRDGILSLLLRYLPISSDPDVPELDLQVFRLSEPLWVAKFTSPQRLKQAIYVTLRGYVGDVIFHFDGWVSDSSEQNLLVQSIGPDQPNPTGQPIRQAHWIFVASTRRNPVGFFGRFKGRVFRSETSPSLTSQTKLLLRYWKTAVALIVWLIAGLLVAYYTWPWRAQTNDRPLVQQVKNH